LSAAAARISPRAVVAFVLGVLSLVSGLLAVAWRSDALLLTVAGFALPALPLAILAWVRIITQPASLRGQAFAGWGVGLSLCGLALGFLGLPAATLQDEAPARAIAADRFRQIARAMHLYVKDHNLHLPPAAVYDEQHRRLYSWRVVLLPYLGHRDLYQQFRLDEPWDGPHNRALLERMPDVYAPPPSKDARAEPFTTFCQILDCPGSPFWGVGGTRVDDDFAKRMAKTILVVEAGVPVPWTKPADVTFDWQRPLPPLGGVFIGERRLRFLGLLGGKGFTAAMGDASVSFVTPGVEETKLREMFCYKDPFFGVDW
jgi:hypothetical protein